MSKLESRRDLMMKLTSAGVAAMVGSGAAPAPSPSGTSAPAGDIQVRLTSGAKSSARRAAQPWAEAAPPRLSRHPVQAHRLGTAKSGGRLERIDWRVKRRSRRQPD